MPAIDLEIIRRAHGEFLREHDAIEAAAARDAGRRALKLFNASQSLVPAPSPQASEYRLVRTSSGKLLVISSRPRPPGKLDDGAKLRPFRQRHGAPDFIGSSSLVSVATLRVRTDQSLRFLRRATETAGGVLELALKRGIERAAKKF